MQNKLLKTFIEVVDKGSFSKASQSLYFSAPAIMKQMNQLEKELGLQLLIR